jgi:hypothetical protein
VSSGGAKVAELRYQEWDQVRYASGATPAPFRFTGQRLDGEPGHLRYSAMKERTWISVVILCLAIGLATAVSPHAGLDVRGFVMIYLVVRLFAVDHPVVGWHDAGLTIGQVPAEDDPWDGE